MFTLQAGQLENALRGSGVPDISAKELVQGLGNCQAPLEHRGGAAFTRVPRDNRFMFPGQRPTSGTPDFYLPPSITNQTIVNIPPWQTVPWTPIPYPEQDQWQPIPYPDWPPGQYPWDDSNVAIAGPVYTGPVTAPSVTAGDLNSNTVTNSGDIVNDGNLTNGGSATFNGPVQNNHNVANAQNVTNKKQVVNEGNVFNNAAVYNEVAHNYNTYNYGPTTNYGDTMVANIFSSGPNEFAGDTLINGGDVNIAGDLLNITSTVINLGDEDTTNVTVLGDTIDVGDTTTNVNVLGDTINLGDTNTKVTVLGDTIDLGDQNTNVTILGDTHRMGDFNTTEITLEGNDIYLVGNVHISLAGGGVLGPLLGQSLTFITDVFWDTATSSFKKVARTIRFIGSYDPTVTTNIVTAVGCPAAPIGASASNLADMP